MQNNLVRFGVVTACIVVTALLGGCQDKYALRDDLRALVRLIEGKPKPPPEPKLKVVEAPKAAVDPMLAKVATAKGTGALEVVYDDGKRARIVTDTPYVSATGRMCRTYTLAYMDGVRIQQRRLACQVDEDAWQTVPYLLQTTHTPN